MPIQKPIFTHFTTFIIYFRTLAGFLNTAAGGTVYIGVSDEGMVEGLVLNCYQVIITFF